jgi:hypothetical protein
MKKVLKFLRKVINFFLKIIFGMLMGIGVSLGRTAMEPEHKDNKTIESEK